MDFESWLSMQRTSITALRVMQGEYVARRSDFGYSATRRLARGTSHPVVKVTRHSVVRARVLLGSTEYDFEPRWQPGQGVTVFRCSPRDTLARDTAELTAGLARAAIKKASEEEYERLRGLAFEADEQRWPEVLRRLTLEDAASFDDALLGSLRAVLAAKNGVELMEARFSSACVLCGRRYSQGDVGPVWEFGETLACAGCLGPAAKAA